MIKDLINKYYDKLSENDLYVLRYILNHLDECKNMNITELASACAISKSSILRMTQKLGFSGYSEFKYSLRREPESIVNDVSLFDKQLNEIEMTRKLFENIQVEPIFESIFQARRIYGYATGWGQRNALEELSRQFVSCKKQMFIIPAVTEFEILLPNIDEQDLVIFISLSGDAKNIINPLRQLSVRKIPTLSITSFQNNHLAELSTFNIYFQSTNLGTYNNVNHISFIGLQTVVDLLYRGYLHYSIAKEKD